MARGSQVPSTSGGSKTNPASEESGVDPNLMSPVRDQGEYPYKNALHPDQGLPDIFSDMTAKTPPDPMGYAFASDTSRARLPGDGLGGSSKRK